MGIYLFSFLAADYFHITIGPLGITIMPESVSFIIYNIHSFITGMWSNTYLYLRICI